MTPTFTPQDSRAFTSAQQRCKKVTGLPCLKHFQKREDAIYRAVCGEKELFDKKQLQDYEMSVIMKELEHLTPEERKEALKKIGVINE